MGKTRFEGVLVRNLPDKKSWTHRDLPMRDDDPRLTIITLREAQQQVPKLANLPMWMAHDPSVEIGRVVKAWITPKRELRAMLELYDEESLACHGIREKILNSLSLSHCAGRNEPLEVSLCKTPRRSGCEIQSELPPTCAAPAAGSANCINSIAHAEQHSHHKQTEITPQSRTVPESSKLTARLLQHEMSAPAAAAAAKANTEEPSSKPALLEKQPTDAAMSQPDATQPAATSSEPQREMTQDELLAEIVTNENMPDTYRDTVLDLAKDRLAKQKQLEEAQKSNEEQQKKIRELELAAEQQKKSHQSDREYLKKFMSNIMKANDLSVSQSEIENSIDQGQLDQPIVRQAVMCMGQKLLDQQLAIPMNRQQQSDLAKIADLRARDPFKTAQRPIARPTAKPQATRSIEDMVLNGRSIDQLLVDFERTHKRSRNML